MKVIYGGLNIKDNSQLSAGKELRFADADSSNYAAIKAPSTLSANYSLTLPVDDGTANQVLSTDGSGVLSWVSSLTSALNAQYVLIGNGSNIATAVDTVSLGDIEASTAGGLFIKAGAIVNADINAGAAIAYSKLNLAGSIVNADINASAAIAYSKLNLASSIVNADIASGAAIAVNKLAALTASKALVSDASGFLSASSVTSTELGYLAGVTSGVQSQLNNITSTINNFEWQPSVLDKKTAPVGGEVSGDRYLVIATATGAFAGQENKIAQYDGSSWVFIAPTAGTFVSVDTEADGLYLYGGSSWNKKYFESTTASTGLTKVGFDVRLDATAAGDGLGFSSGVLSVNVDNSTIELNSDTARLKDGGIMDAKINASAAIALSKLAAVTASKALVSDGSGVISASSVTSTELGYVSGVTSSIQTQLDTKMKRVTNSWVTGDGASKVITHSLNTKDVIVQIYDMTDDSTIEIDSVVRTSVNAITVTASEAPGASGWKVVIIG